MSVRQEKVQEQLVHQISDIIHRDLRDPRLGFVTLTGAEISRDLRHAKIYVSVLGDENARKQSLQALKSASGLLRGEFARRAHLRVAPELEFRWDEGIERGHRIFELLHSVEGDLRPHTEPAPEPPQAVGSSDPALAARRAESSGEAHEETHGEERSGPA